MKLGIMQPYFFPYIGYFQLIKSVDKFILYSEVNYIKKGWINRNRINVINRGPQYINVPIKKHLLDEKISGIMIDNSANWSRKMLNDIYFNYKKANFFEDVFPIIEKVLLKKHETIEQINNEAIIAICNFLEYNTIIEHDGSKYFDVEKKILNKTKDYTFDNTQIDNKAIRILEICKLENAATYINAIGGKDLYNRELFENLDIDIFFINSEPYQYFQFSNLFIPHLSIIDVLMHNGRFGTQLLTNNYSLV